MKPTLVFIAPIWTPELDELLQITKESFSLKVLTQKLTHSFEDPYIEILQCFDSYSPIELAKLIPWFIHLQAPQFHLILPTKASHSQLAGIGAILSFARALPKSYISHSPWPKENWSFSIWLKAFQNLFDSTLQTRGTRSLSLPKTQSSQKTRVTTKSLDLFNHLWVFPSHHGPEQDWSGLINGLVQRRENLLEFWNWEHLPIRKQNKIRQQFSHFWEQFRSRTPRSDFEDWKGVQFLVLIGKNELPFSESELLDLALIYNVNIVMDTETRKKLLGPWKDGDTFWLWHPNLNESEERPWNNPNP